MNIDQKRTESFISEKEKTNKFNRGTGLRYNSGKLRYDLVNPYAHEQMVEVLTKGSEKYSDRNWENGMSWQSVIASAKRHLAAIESGEDYDKEDGLLHAAHLACNAHFLTAYYKLYPQGDDRPKRYLKPLRVGLDVDGILANFTDSLLAYSNHDKHIPLHWNDPIISQDFDNARGDDEFWLNMIPLIMPNELPFEPSCYITARNVNKKITEGWLDNIGFPKAPVYSVGIGESKVNIALKANIDLFIDDHYSNFVELNNAGVFTLLYTAPYNTKYDVGHMRLNSFSEFKERFM